MPAMNDLQFCNCGPNIAGMARSYSAELNGSDVARRNEGK
jgi:hypothetical protein